jgi:UDP-glucose 4-epimerase
VRAVVTGGAGFIGSHLVDVLVARGDDVLVLDNFATGKRDNIPDGAVLHEGDIRSDADAAFDEGRPEACFHVAAQADVGTSVERPEFDADVNVLGTLRVLEAARRHEAQIVFTSTGGAMYGECERPAREEDERTPVAPYGTSKLCGEEYLAMYNRLHGTRHVSLRLGNVFGPRQMAKLEGGVIAIFMNRLHAGERVTIFGDGGQQRDFVYVADVVAAMLAAVGRNGGVFNVGSGVATSVNDLYAGCRRVAGTGEEPEYAPPRAGELYRSVLDPARAEQELGWRRAHDLESGLRETWSWVSAR